MSRPKMSEPDTQLQENILNRTADSKQIETATSLIEAPQAAPPSWSLLSGMRYLTLSPYRRAMLFFEDWEEQTRNGSLAWSPFSEVSAGECSIMSDGRDGEFMLPPSIIEEEEAKLEHERCRVLGILKCFIYNFEEGTLSTGDEVREKLAEALKRMVALSENRDAATELGCEKVKESGGTEEHSVFSADEQMLIVEMIDEYVSLVLKNDSDVCGGVLAFAKKILGWIASGDVKVVGDSAENSEPAH